MAMRSGIKKGKIYFNAGKDWTEEEKEIIMTSEKTDKELSVELGRTISSITNQRFLIRNEKINKEG